MKTRYTKQHRVLLWCITALGALQMAGWGATLTNRYSFNEAAGTTNVIDSVGGQNGYLVNTTADGSGQATLANGVLNSGDGSGQYVKLPNNLLTNYTAVSIEVWVTPTLDSTTGGAFWARIWDFGNDNNGQQPFFWFRVGDQVTGVRGDIVPTNSLPAGTVTALPTSTPLLDQQQNFVVWTSDGNTWRARIYVNGVLAGSSDSFAANPYQMITTNDVLGRSQFDADPYINASYNEFRIYDGALDPLQVAADYEAGPDVDNASYGTITNIQLQVKTTMPKTSYQTAQVLAQASGLTNQAVNIVDSVFPVTFTSGDTNILTVDTNGVIFAATAGTTTIAADYGAFSSTQTVTVISTTTRLLNRYSFNDGTANDSVGGQNGTLVGTASVSGGQLVLDGAAGDYVALNPYQISSTNMQTGAFTIETWGTVATNIGTYAPYCMFGNSSGTLGSDYTYLSASYAGNATRIAVGPDYSAEDYAAGPRTLNVTNAQIVGVYQPGANSIRLYINGSLVGSGTLNNTTLDTIDDVYSFIGQSLFSADPTFSGTINEFRIYDGALDPFQVDAAYVNGPDSTNMDIGTLTNFDIGVGASPIQVGMYRQMSASMHFTIATNVNVLATAGLSLTSSDTNVLTVTSPGGMIHAVGTGTANVTGIYAYTPGSSTTTTYFTNSASMTVVAPTSTPSILIHRYSFNDGTPDDSVGTANGTLENTATVNPTNGLLELNNPNFSAGGLPYTNGFLSLPASILPTTGGATIEMWFTFTGSGFNSEAWTFSSGNPTNAPVGGQYMMQVISVAQPSNPPGGAGTGGNRLVQALNGYNPGPEVNCWGTTPGMGVNGGGYLDGGYYCMSAVTVAPDGTLSYYLWSIDQGGLGGLQMRAAGEPLSNFTFSNAYLGRSAFYADDGTSGTVNEFRIYSGTRSQAQIEADYAAGPDTLVVPKVTLTVVVNGSNVDISWPSSGTSGYQLYTSSSLGASASWSLAAGTPSSAGGTTTQSVPISGNTQFFRLQ